MTYHIKEGLQDREFNKFEDTFNNPEKNENLRKFIAMGDKVWIVKPGENTNRGCGITVCREISEIKKLMSNNMVNGKKRTFII